MSDESEAIRPYRYIDYIRSISPHIDEEQMRDVAFYGGISDPDDATAVIRGMAHLEANLLELVQRNLEHPDLINPNSFALQQRILWARALGEIGPLTASALERLAAIRNRMAHKHTRVFAPDDAIIEFLKALNKLPDNAKGVLDAPMPTHPSIDPPFTELRWKMRMGISLLNGQLHTYTLVPPLRTRERPGPHPSIELHAGYEPRPAY